MSQQAQLDALEHLVLAIIKNNEMMLVIKQIAETAKGSIMGSDGPPGAEQKAQASAYLDHLLSQIKTKPR